MTRRLKTLVVGVITLSVLIVAVTLVRIPYIALVPGPTINTLGEYEGAPLIVVEGKEPNKVSGNLNLTTVGVTSEISIVEAIADWISDDAAVVPTETVYPPTQTRDETDKKNQEDYAQSEDSAIQAAMNYLGYPKKVVVVTPPEGTPLKPGDAIDKVNGQQIDSFETLKNLMSQTPPGTTLTVEYQHNGQPATTPVVTKEPQQGQTGSLMGVTTSFRGYGGFTVSFAKTDIGGPSAGLMFTLGIIDLVGPQPLTDGEFIAGTGTIDPDGKVGPIGGIRFKLKKAAEVGAKLFLTPAENCAEAQTEPPHDGPVLAKVDTLQDAVAAVQAFTKGEKVATCG